MHLVCPKHFGRAMYMVGSETFCPNCKVEEERGTTNIMEEVHNVLGTKCEKHNTLLVWKAPSWICPQCVNEEVEPEKRTSLKGVSKAQGWFEKISEMTGKNCSRHPTISRYEYSWHWDGHEWCCVPCMLKMSAEDIESDDPEIKTFTRHILDQETHDFLTFMTNVSPSVRSDFVKAMGDLDAESILSDFVDHLEYSTPAKYNTRFIPKYYRMDGATEDLLFDGEELRDGMTVLIADSDYRVDIRDEMSGSNLELALNVNRWGKVSKLRTSDSMVSFIAEYEDGTKARRGYPRDVAWYVKKDIHEPEETTQEAGERRL